MSLSAYTKTAASTATTTHKTSYCPEYTEVNDPMNQMPSCCRLSVVRARKVDTALTTAPSMMPMIGTMSELRSATRLRNKKKIIVPAKAKMTAPTMRSRTVEVGNTIIVASRPSPAHSVVPVVVGSTKRFCVSSCLTSPHMAIAAPASTSAMVRGTRVMPNISPPSSAPNTSYCPTNREAASSAATTTTPMPSFQSSNRPRLRIRLCVRSTG